MVHIYHRVHVTKFANAVFHHQGHACMSADCQHIKGNIIKHIYDIALDHIVTCCTNTLSVSITAAIVLTVDSEGVHEV